MARSIAGLINKRMKSVKRLERWLDKVYPKIVYKEFVRLTPRDSGYARRHTDINYRADGFDIVGKRDYKYYAPVLDQGLYPKSPKGGAGKTTNGFSKQAPEGMSKPTERYAKKRLTRYMRRLK